MDTKPVAAPVVRPNAALDLLRSYAKIYREAAPRGVGSKVDQLLLAKAAECEEALQLLERAAAFPS
jgi:hypothetical protein